MRTRFSRVADVPDAGCDARTDHSAAQPAPNHQRRRSRAAGHRGVADDYDRLARVSRHQEDRLHTPRVVAIGASTTEQIHLDDKSTWTHLLQEQLESRLPSVNVEVINTGVSGLRAEHHLETLEQVLDFEPDLVIFLIGINDWIRHVYTEFGFPANTPRPLHPKSTNRRSKGSATSVMTLGLRACSSTNPPPTTWMRRTM